MSKITGISLSLLGLLFSSLLWAHLNTSTEKIPTCSLDKAITPGTFCSVPLDKLHPTQAVIGYTASYFKQKEFEAIANPRKRASYENLDEYLINDANFTAVQGTDGQIYLSDGHHNVRALWVLNTTCDADDCIPPRPAPADQAIYVTITASYFGQHLSKEKFWQALINSNNAYPYLLQKGTLKKVSAASFAEAVPQSFDPKSSNPLADYPLRSAAGLAKDWGFLKAPKDKNDNNINFYQFYWAECLAALDYQPEFDKDGRLTVNSTYQAIDLLTNTSKVKQQCSSMIIELGDGIIPQHKTVKSIAEDVISGELM